VQRRTFLSLIPASAAALLAARCGGSGGSGEVVVNAPPALPGTPTPQVSPAVIPPPEVVLSAESVSQAGTLLVSLVGDVTDGSAKFLDRTYPLIQGARSIFAFIGIDAEDPPGEHPLEVSFTQTNGTTGSLSQPIEITATEWSVDSVNLPEDFLRRLLDPAIVNREVDFLRQTYSGMTLEKLWSSDSAWLLPIQGILTTRFGEARSYNGSEPSGHHLGTDIGGGEGEPIQVTQAGRVTMARQLEQRGNMVIVDHGGGVFSGYAHMKSFAVGEGQAVAAGEVIGEVGSSGLSTGAHLHWEMCISGIWVDALRFTDGTNGF
jgi:murein DD-endopeptidase MepM/ murein hydrolase activator NlpD